MKEEPCCGPPTSLLTGRGQGRKISPAGPGKRSQQTASQDQTERQHRCALPGRAATQAGVARGLPSDGEPHSPAGPPPVRVLCGLRGPTSHSEWGVATPI